MSEPVTGVGGVSASQRGQSRIIKFQVLKKELKGDNLYIEGTSRASAVKITIEGKDQGYVCIVDKQKWSLEVNLPEIPSQNIRFKTTEIYPNNIQVNIEQAETVVVKPPDYKVKTGGVDLSDIPLSETGRLTQKVVNLIQKTGEGNPAENIDHNLLSTWTSLKASEVTYLTDEFGKWSKKHCKDGKVTMTWDAYISKDQRLTAIVKVVTTQSQAVALIEEYESAKAVVMEKAFANPAQFGIGSQFLKFHRKITREGHMRRILERSFEEMGVRKQDFTWLMGENDFDHAKNIFIYNTVAKSEVLKKLQYIPAGIFFDRDKDILAIKPNAKDLIVNSHVLTRQQKKDLLVILSNSSNSYQRLLALESQLKKTPDDADLSERIEELRVIRQVVYTAAMREHPESEALKDEFRAMITDVSGSREYKKRMTEILSSSNNPLAKSIISQFKTDEDTRKNFAVYFNNPDKLSPMLQKMKIDGATADQVYDLLTGYFFSDNDSEKENILKEAIANKNPAVQLFQKLFTEKDFTKLKQYFSKEALSTIAKNPAAYSNIVYESLYNEFDAARYKGLNTAEHQIWMQLRKVVDLDSKGIAPMAEGSRNSVYRAGNIEIVFEDENKLKAYQAYLAKNPSGWGIFQKVKLTILKPEDLYTTHDNANMMINTDIQEQLIILGYLDPYTPVKTLVGATGGAQITAEEPFTLGYYGAGTRGAIAQFKKDCGLSSNSDLTTETVALLQNRYDQYLAGSDALKSGDMVVVYKEAGEGVLLAGNKHGDFLPVKEDDPRYLKFKKDFMTALKADNKPYLTDKSKVKDAAAQAMNFYKAHYSRFWGVPQNQSFEQVFYKSALLLKKTDEKTTVKQAMELYRKKIQHIDRRLQKTDVSVRGVFLRQKNDILKVLGYLGTLKPDEVFSSNIRIINVNDRFAEQVMFSNRDKKQLLIDHLKFHTALGKRLYAAHHNLPVNFIITALEYYKPDLGTKVYESLLNSFTTGKELNKTHLAQLLKQLDTAKEVDENRLVKAVEQAGRRLDENLYWQDAVINKPANKQGAIKAEDIIAYSSTRSFVKEQPYAAFNLVNTRAKLAETPFSIPNPEVASTISAGTISKFIAQIKSADTEPYVRVQFTDEKIKLLKGIKENFTDHEEIINYILEKRPTGQPKNLKNFSKRLRLTNDQLQELRGIRDLLSGKDRFIGEYLLIESILGSYMPDASILNQKEIASIEKLAKFIGERDIVLNPQQDFYVQREIADPAYKKGIEVLNRVVRRSMAMATIPKKYSKWDKLLDTNGLIPELLFRTPDKIFLEAVKGLISPYEPMPWVQDAAAWKIIQLKLQYFKDNPVLLASYMARLEQMQDLLNKADQLRADKKMAAIFGPEIVQQIIETDYEMKNMLSSLTRIDKDFYNWIVKKHIGPGYLEKRAKDVFFGVINAAFIQGQGFEDVITGRYYPEHKIPALLEEGLRDNSLFASGDWQSLSPAAGDPKEAKYKQALSAFLNFADIAVPGEQSHNMNYTMMALPQILGKHGLQTLLGVKPPEMHLGAMVKFHIFNLAQKRSAAEGVAFLVKDSTLKIDEISSEMLSIYLAHLIKMKAETENDTLKVGKEINVAQDIKDLQAIIKDLNTFTTKLSANIDISALKTIKSPKYEYDKKTGELKVIGKITVNEVVELSTVFTGEDDIKALKGLFQRFQKGRTITIGNTRKRKDDRTQKIIDIVLLSGQKKLSGGKVIVSQTGIGGGEKKGGVSSSLSFDNFFYNSLDRTLNTRMMDNPFWSRVATSALSVPLQKIKTDANFGVFVPFMILAGTASQTLSNIVSLFKKDHLMMGERDKNILDVGVPTAKLFWQMFLYRNIGAIWYFGGDLQKDIKEDNYWSAYGNFINLNFFTMQSQGKGGFSQSPMGRMIDLCSLDKFVWRHLESTKQKSVAEYGIFGSGARYLENSNSKLLKAGKVVINPWQAYFNRVARMAADSPDANKNIGSIEPVAAKKAALLSTRAWQALNEPITWQKVKSPFAQGSKLWKTINEGNQRYLWLTYQSMNVLNYSIAGWKKGSKYAEEAIIFNRISSQVIKEGYKGEMAYWETVSRLNGIQRMRGKTDDAKYALDPGKSVLKLDQGTYIPELGNTTRLQSIVRQSGLAAKNTFDVLIDPNPDSKWVESMKVTQVSTGRFGTGGKRISYVLHKPSGGALPSMCSLEICFASDVSPQEAQRLIADLRKEISTTAHKEVFDVRDEILSKTRIEEIISKRKLDLDAGAQKMLTEMPWLTRETADRFFTGIKDGSKITEVQMRALIRTHTQSQYSFARPDYDANLANNLVWYLSNRLAPIPDSRVRGEAEKILDAYIKGNASKLQDSSIPALRQFVLDTVTEYSKAVRNARLVQDDAVKVIALVEGTQRISIDDAVNRVISGTADPVFKKMLAHYVECRQKKANIPNERQLISEYFSGQAVDEHTRRAINQLTGEGKTTTIEGVEYIYADRGKGKKVVTTSWTQEDSFNGFRKRAAVLNARGINTLFISSLPGEDKYIIVENTTKNLKAIKDAKSPTELLKKGLAREVSEDGLRKVVNSTDPRRAIDVIEMDFGTLGFELLYDSTKRGKPVLPLDVLKNAMLIMDESDYSRFDMRNNPSIISSPTGKKHPQYKIMLAVDHEIRGWFNQAAGGVLPEYAKYIRINHEDQRVSLKDEGYKILKENIINNPELAGQTMDKLMPMIENGLYVWHFLQEGKDFGTGKKSYVLIDQNTNRYLLSMNLNDGHHNMLEARLGFNPTEKGSRSLRELFLDVVASFKTSVEFSGTNNDVASRLAADYIRLHAIEPVVPQSRVHMPEMMCKSSEVAMKTISDTVIRHVLAGDPMLIHNNILKGAGVTIEGMTARISADLITALDNDASTKKRIITEINDKRGVIIADNISSKELADKYIMCEMVDKPGDPGHMERIRQRAGYAYTATLANIANRATDFELINALTKERTAKRLVAINTAMDLDSRTKIQKDGRIGRVEYINAVFQRAGALQYTIFSMEDPYFKRYPQDKAMMMSLMFSSGNEKAMVGKGFIPSPIIIPKDNSAESITERTRIADIYYKAGIIDAAAKTKLINTGDFDSGKIRAEIIAHMGSMGFAADEIEAFKTGNYSEKYQAGIEVYETICRYYEAKYRTTQTMANPADQAEKFLKACKTEHTNIAGFDTAKSPENLLKLYAEKYGITIESAPAKWQTAECAKAIQLLFNLKDGDRTNIETILEDKNKSYDAKMSEISQLARGKQATYTAFIYRNFQSYLESQMLRTYGIADSINKDHWKLDDFSKFLFEKFAIDIKFDTEADLSSRQVRETVEAEFFKIMQTHAAGEGAAERGERSLFVETILGQGEKVVLNALDALEKEAGRRYLGTMPLDQMEKDAMARVISEEFSRLLFETKGKKADGSLGIIRLMHKFHKPKAKAPVDVSQVPSSVKMTPVELKVLEKLKGMERTGVDPNAKTITFEKDKVFDITTDNGVKAINEYLKSMGSKKLIFFSAGSYIFGNGTLAQDGTRNGQPVWRLEFSNEDYASKSMNMYGLIRNGRLLGNAGDFEIITRSDMVQENIVTKIINSAKNDQAWNHLIAKQLSTACGIDLSKPEDLHNPKLIKLSADVVYGHEHGHIENTLKTNQRSYLFSVGGGVLARIDELEADYGKKGALERALTDYDNATVDKKPQDAEDAKNRILVFLFHHHDQNAATDKKFSYDSFHFQRIGDIKRYFNEDGSLNIKVVRQLQKSTMNYLSQKGNQIIKALSIKGITPQEASDVVARAVAAIPNEIKGKGSSPTKLIMPTRKVTVESAGTKGTTVELRLTIQEHEKIFSQVEDNGKLRLCKDTEVFRNPARLLEIKKQMGIAENDSVVKYMNDKLGFEIKAGTDTHDKLLPILMNAENDGKQFYRGHNFQTNHDLEKASTYLNLENSVNRRISAANPKGMTLNQFNHILSEMQQKGYDQKCPDKVKLGNVEFTKAELQNFAQARFNYFEIKKEFINNNPLMNALPSQEQDAFLMKALTDAQQQKGPKNIECVCIPLTEGVKPLLNSMSTVFEIIHGDQKIEVRLLNADVERMANAKNAGTEQQFGEELGKITSQQYIIDQTGRIPDIAQRLEIAFEERMMNEANFQFLGQFTQFMATRHYENSIKKVFKKHPQDSIERREALRKAKDDAFKLAQALQQTLFEDAHKMMLEGEGGKYSKTKLTEPDMEKLMKKLETRAEECKDAEKYKQYIDEFKEKGLHENADYTRQMLVDYADFRSDQPGGLIASGTQWYKKFTRFHDMGLTAPGIQRSRVTGLIQAPVRFGVRGALEDSIVETGFQLCNSLFGDGKPMDWDKVASYAWAGAKHDAAYGFIRYVNTAIFQVTNAQELTKVSLLPKILFMQNKGMFTGDERRGVTGVSTVFGMGAYMGTQKLIDKLIFDKLIKNNKMIVQSPTHNISLFIAGIFALVATRVVSLALGSKEVNEALSLDMFGDTSGMDILNTASDIGSVLGDKMTVSWLVNKISKNPDKYKWLKGISTAIPEEQMVKLFSLSRLSTASTKALKGTPIVVPLAALASYFAHKEEIHSDNSVVSSIGKTDFLIDTALLAGSEAAGTIAALYAVGTATSWKGVGVVIIVGTTIYVVADTAIDWQYKAFGGKLRDDTAAITEEMGKHRIKLNRRHVLAPSGYRDERNEILEKIFQRTYDYNALSPLRGCTIEYEHIYDLNPIVIQEIKKYVQEIGIKPRHIYIDLKQQEAGKMNFSVEITYREGGETKKAYIKSSWLIPQYITGDYGADVYRYLSRDFRVKDDFSVEARVDKKWQPLEEDGDPVDLFFKRGFFGDKPTYFLFQLMTDLRQVGVLDKSDLKGFDDQDALWKALDKGDIQELGDVVTEDSNKDRWKEIKKILTKTLNEYKKTIGHKSKYILDRQLFMMLQSAVNSMKAAELLIKNDNKVEALIGYSQMYNLVGENVKPQIKKAMDTLIDEFKQQEPFINSMKSRLWQTAEAKLRNGDAAGAFYAYKRLSAYYPEDGAIKSTIDQLAGFTPDLAKQSKAMISAGCDAVEQEIILSMLIEYIELSSKALKALDAGKVKEARAFESAILSIGLPLNTAKVKKKINTYWQENKQKLFDPFRSMGTMDLSGSFDSNVKQLIYFANLENVKKKYGSDIHNLQKKARQLLDNLGQKWKIKLNGKFMEWQIGFDMGYLDYLSVRLIRNEIWSNDLNNLHDFLSVVAGKDLKQADEYLAEACPRLLAAIKLLSLCGKEDHPLNMDTVYWAQQFVKAAGITITKEEKEYFQLPWMRSHTLKLLDPRQPEPPRLILSPIPGQQLKPLSTNPFQPYIDIQGDRPIVLNSQGWLSMQKQPLAPNGKGRVIYQDPRRTITIQPEKPVNNNQPVIIFNEQDNQGKFKFSPNLKNFYNKENSSKKKKKK
ncbi:hypothetical protein ACFL57_02300 [Candidatus Margulisiibacteriota bacterium]